MELYKIILIINCDADFLGDFLGDTGFTRARRTGEDNLSAVALRDHFFDCGFDSIFNIILICHFVHSFQKSEFRKKVFCFCPHGAVKMLRIILNFFVKILCIFFDV